MEKLDVKSANSKKDHFYAMIFLYELENCLLKREEQTACTQLKPTSIMNFEAIHQRAFY